MVILRIRKKYWVMEVMLLFLMLKVIVINDNFYGGLSFINIKYVKEMDFEELKNGWGIFWSVVICLDVVDDKYFSNLLIFRYYGVGFV